MELLASPSLFFAFLAGTAFGDLLAGRFPLSFVSPRGELMSSGRLFVRPRIAWVSWLISSEEAAVLSLSCREACAGTALRSSGSECLSGLLRPRPQFRRRGDRPQIVLTSLISSA